MSDARASSSDRYTRPQDGNAWVEDAAEQGKIGTQRLLAVEAGPPTPEVRAGLALTTGEDVVVRRRLILADDQPVEIAESYYPASIAAGTALAEDKKIRGGAVRFLAGAGYPLDESIDRITSERAGEFADLLAVDQDEPLTVTRRTSSTDNAGPVEYAVNRMVSSRVAPLEYRLRNTAQ
jgi:GntR family transcriptional regulator